MWKRLLAFEPALVRAVAPVVVLIAANIGLNISDQVDSAVTTVLAVLAVLPLIQAWWTRSAVTPNDAVLEYVPADSDIVVAGPANEFVGEGDLIREYNA